MTAIQKDGLHRRVRLLSGAALVLLSIGACHRNNPQVAKARIVQASKIVFLTDSKHEYELDLGEAKAIIERTIDARRIASPEKGYIPGVFLITTESGEYRFGLFSRPTPALSVPGSEPGESLRLEIDARDYTRLLELILQSPMTHRPI